MNLSWSTVSKTTDISTRMNLVTVDNNILARVFGFRMVRLSSVLVSVLGPQTKVRGYTPHRSRVYLKISAPPALLANLSIMSTLT